MTTRDELEYLSAPLETDTNLDLLAYWKLKKGIDLESTWPKLAKMAKQYLASPFSSAGVERVFSAAGKMHTTTCASPRRTAPLSTRCSLHSMRSDGGMVATAGRGDNSGHCS